MKYSVLLFFLPMFLGFAQRGYEYHDYEDALPHRDSVYALWIRAEDVPSLPPMDTAFPNLEILFYVSQEEIAEEVMVTFSRIPKLRVLNLSGQFYSLPSTLSLLHNLETLNIYAPVDSFPSCLCTLDRLKEVSMQAVHPYFPPCVTNMTSLEALDLFSLDRLRSFPELICRIPNLHTLRLSADSLRYLPASFADMKLTEVYIGSANTDALIHSLFQLKHLKKVSFVASVFKQLPLDMRCLELEELHIYDNTELDCDSAIRLLTKLPQLKALSLSYVQMDTMPPAIGLLTSLESLEINDAGIKYVSPEFFTLTNLTHLSYRGHHIPISSSMGVFRSLEYLDLSGSKQIDWKVVSSLTRLTYLSVDACHLRSLPSSIGNLEQLEYLSICGNRIVHYPASFLELPNVKTIEGFQEDFTRKTQRTLTEHFGEDVIRVIDYVHF